MNEVNPLRAAEFAMLTVLFKLEGQLIRRNEDFHMDNRLLLDKINFDEATVTIDDKICKFPRADFPTIARNGDRYTLTDDETLAAIVADVAAVSTEYQRFVEVDKRFIVFFFEVVSVTAILVSDGIGRVGLNFLRVLSDCIVEVEIQRRGICGSRQLSRRQKSADDSSQIVAKKISPSDMRRGFRLSNRKIFDR